MPAAIEVRGATVDDLPAIVRLLDDGRGREATAAPLAAEYRRAFDAIKSDPRTLLVVADDEGTVVGTLQVSFLPTMNLHGGTRAQVEGVFVDAAARGHGVGHALMQWAIDQASARGCRLVQLTTHKDRARAKAFYESLGFSATHEGMKLYLS